MSRELDSDLGFSEEEIDGCLAREGLLSLELEFTRTCNLRCTYCYASAGDALERELSLDELVGTIEQARGLGARRIILLGGGEPLLFPAVTEVVRHIDALGMSQAIFTNGICITPDLARFLFEHRVTVAVKQNSFLPAVQDALAGVAGAHAGIQRGLRHLMEAGYPDRDHPLCIQSVICRPNRDEIAAMWIWARERGITPYFEALTEQGRVRDHPELALFAEELQQVFQELSDVDRGLFGATWTAKPPIAGFTCRRHLYSCLVNSQGFVQPCPGVEISVGNIREKPLSVILRESRVIRDLRRVYRTIASECRACEFAGGCYGCRGNAFQATGDFLAADPGCWLRNAKAHAACARGGNR
ncbi:MAG: radical SAM protein [Zetaproteobacteria bacterium]|nr:MAG: radical SAM protein [Zetaproteobacteria bacterium]